MIETRADAPVTQDEDIDKLWASYKATGSSEYKDKILLHYVFLVKRIVRRMMPKYSGHNEYDDLVNCGIIGLIDAVEKFDLRHGVKFETYAVSRIRGEILDNMRAQDWAPSSLRRRINSITDAYEVLESEQGGTPSDQSIADRLDMPVAEVQKVLTQTHTLNLVYFEDTLSACAAIENVVCQEDDMPENVFLKQEMKEIMAEMIESLPENERLVITLYYYEELLLKEIAQVLHVSESRVSQIHSKVLAKMRTRLQKLL